MTGAQASSLALSRFALIAREDACAPVNVTRSLPLPVLTGLPISPHAIPVSPTVAQIAGAIDHMAPIPIIIHVVTPPVSHACTLREAVWPTPVPTSVAGIMTVHELSTLPILVPAARFKTAMAGVVAIKKHIRLSSQTSAASLRKRGCGYQR